MKNSSDISFSWCVLLLVNVATGEIDLVSCFRCCIQYRSISSRGHWRNARIATNAYSHRGYRSHSNYPDVYHTITLKGEKLGGSTTTPITTPCTGKILGLVRRVSLTCSSVCINMSSWSSHSLRNIIAILSHVARSALVFICVLFFGEPPALLQSQILVHVIFLNSDITCIDARIVQAPTQTTRSMKFGRTR